MVNQPARPPLKADHAQLSGTGLSCAEEARWRNGDTECLKRRSSRLTTPAKLLQWRASAWLNPKP